MTNIHRALYASQFLHEHLVLAAHATDSLDRELNREWAENSLKATAKHMGYALVPLEEVEPEQGKQEVEKEAA